MAAPGRESSSSRESLRSERSVTSDVNSSIDTPKTDNREPDFPGSVAREDCLSVKSQALSETGQSAECSIWKVSCLNAKKLRSDKDAPRCVSPSTTTEAPRRANDLRDSDDARINMSIKFKEEPNFMPPNRDSEEPRKAAHRERSAKLSTDED